MKSEDENENENEDELHFPSRHGSGCMIDI